MTRSARLLAWALLCLGARSAQATLIVDVTGTPGSGVTTWVLSGSSTTIAAGTIRTSVGSSSFSLGDSFEPDVDGNFISNGTLQDVLFEVTGVASITIGGVTRTITHLYLDDDSIFRDDVGIRTLTALEYGFGQASSWTGTFTVALDINNFIPGTYRLNTTQANGGGFSFSGVNDTVLNFSEGTGVPEPGTMGLCALGLVMAGCWRARRGRMVS